MKHIVFVIGNYKNGGVPMRSTNLANAFAENGYRCTILVTKDVSENIFFTLHKNVEIVSLKEYAAAHSSDKKVLLSRRKTQKKLKLYKRLRYLSRFFPKWDKSIAAEIKGIRKSEGLKAYMINNTSSLYITFGISYYEPAFYAARDLGCKLIYAERNAPELEFPTEPHEKERLIKAVSLADGAVLQTRNELEFFEGKLKNATVIHNPVKSNLPEPYCGERRKVIVNFCRIAKQKNIPLMLDAFMEFKKTHPQYTLEIYGNTVAENEEALKEEYIRMIKEMNAESIISILPPRADIHSAVLDCAMFISSSDFEGLSNSMIEAMAIGLPCVCTDCLGGGAREMIVSGENGLLVPIKNPSALAKAMCQMVDDNELAEKCSRNAAEIRKELSAESIALDWLKIIEKIN